MCFDFNYLIMTLKQSGIFLQSFQSDIFLWKTSVFFSSVRRIINIAVPKIYTTKKKRKKEKKRCCRHPPPSREVPFFLPAMRIPTADVAYKPPVIPLRSSSTFPLQAPSAGEVKVTSLVHFVELTRVCWIPGADRTFYLRMMETGFPFCLKLLDPWDGV